jgi:hypothetical protein
LNGLVDWAFVNGFVLFAIWGKWNGSAVYDWDHTEWFLREGFFKLSDSWIPSCTFDLETEDISTFLDWWKIWLPVKLLEDISLDVKLVKLSLLLFGVDLLGGSQE